MKVAAHLLIEDLMARTKANLDAAGEFEKLSNEELNWKSNPESWSVLECIEHLNLYGDYYLPEIKKRMQQAATQKTSSEFKSGLLGNYFAKKMLPKEKLRKIKTFKDKNPLNSQLTHAVLGRFGEQQKMLLLLLEQARKQDLSIVKTGISISKFIKLRLGDTFRVLVYHNQRHIVQAKRVIDQQGSLEAGIPQATALKANRVKD